MKPDCVTYFQATCYFQATQIAPCSATLEGLNEIVWVAHYRAYMSQQKSVPCFLSFLVNIYWKSRWRDSSNIKLVFQSEALNFLFLWWKGETILFPYLCLVKRERTVWQIIKERPVAWFFIHDASSNSLYMYKFKFWTIGFLRSRRIFKIFINQKKSLLSNLTSKAYLSWRADIHGTSVNLMNRVLQEHVHQCAALCEALWSDVGWTADVVICLCLMCYCKPCIISMNHFLQKPEERSPSSPLPIYL